MTPVATVEHMVKTTVELPDDLLASAKGRAAAERRPLRAVVESALRDYLAPAGRTEAFRLDDASVGGNGPRPEFRGRSFDAITEAIYEGRGT